MTVRLSDLLIVAVLAIPAALLVMFAVRVLFALALAVEGAR